jgi:hypothetical protein
MAKSFYLQFGAVLLVLGFVLRHVESVELTAPATRTLAGIVGPSPDSPHGAVRQFAIDTLEPRHRLIPPKWLSWSMLSAGGIMLAMGAMRRK